MGSNVDPNVRLAKSGGVNNSSNTAATDSSKGSSNSVVAISGRAMMLSRLFGQDESNYTGEVMTNKSDASGALVPYLTKDDRAMLEKMYVYSNDNGIDLKHVDALGQDLAVYRRFGASAAPKDLYDTAGHSLKVELSAVNKAAAERIASGSAIASTTIDQGFLRSELTVGGHAVNHEFLERMVGVFSSSADISDRSGNPASRGAIAAYNAESNKLVNIASKNVELVIPEADYVNVNGVGHWRTQEHETPDNLGNVIGSNGSAISDLLSSGETNVREFLTLLDGYSKNKNIDRKDMGNLISLLKSPSADGIWSLLSDKKPSDV